MNEIYWEKIAEIERKKSKISIAVIDNIPSIL